MSRLLSAFKPPPRRDVLLSAASDALQQPMAGITELIKIVCGYLPGGQVLVAVFPPMNQSDTKPCHIMRWCPATAPSPPSPPPDSYGGAMIGVDDLQSVVSFGGSDSSYAPHRNLNFCTGLQAMTIAEHNKIFGRSKSSSPPASSGTGTGTGSGGGAAETADSLEYVYAFTGSDVRIVQLRSNSLVYSSLADAIYFPPQRDYTSGKPIKFIHRSDDSSPAAAAGAAVPTASAAFDVYYFTDLNSGGGGGGGYYVSAAAAIWSVSKSASIKPGLAFNTDTALYQRATESFERHDRPRPFAVIPGSSAAAPSQPATAGVPASAVLLWQNRFVLHPIITPHTALKSRRTKLVGYSTAIVAFDLTLNPNTPQAKWCHQIGASDCQPSTAYQYSAVILSDRYLYRTGGRHIAATGSGSLALTTAPVTAECAVIDLREAQTYVYPPPAPDALVSPTETKLVAPDVSDGGVWKSIAPMNHARRLHSIAAVDDQLIVIGGIREAIDPHHTAKDSLLPAECYDPSANRWTVLTAFPHYRGTPCVTVLTP